MKARAESRKPRAQSLEPKLRFFTRIPVRHKIGVRQPHHRLQKRINRIIHVPEVDVGYVVTRLVILLVKPVAGDSLSDHSCLCKDVIVGALEKLLVRMRIPNQFRPMCSEFRSKIAALPSC